MPAGLLGIESLDRVEIESILDRARDFQPEQDHRFKRLDLLRGRMVVNLFFEASTRTRTSFEIAAKRLGADAISITASGSSVSKGESLVDTLNTLNAMHPDAIIMRHSASGAPHFLARHMDVPIVNAGDGLHEHPTQALLDARRPRPHQVSNLSKARRNRNNPQICCFETTECVQCMWWRRFPIRRWGIAIGQNGYSASHHLT